MKISELQNILEHYKQEPYEGNEYILGTTNYSA